MSRFAIHASDGSLRATAPALEYHGEWMGECYVTLTVKSPAPIAFEIGDYVEYRGERFELNYKPACAKQADRDKYGEAFAYENIKFNSLSDELTRCDFLDVTPQDNEIHYTQLPTFSFYAASVRDLAERIQANLDRLYKNDKAWTVEVYPDYAEKTNVSISVSNIKVWGALELAVNEFGCYFVIRNRTITIGTAGIPTTQIFKYGKGQGLRKIEEQTEDNEEIITRLRAYGNTRNMPARYYNKILKNATEAYLPNNMAVSNLMLPGFPTETTDPYIDSANASIYGVREATVFFDGTDGLDDIYPSIEGMTSQMLIDAGIEVAQYNRGDLDALFGATQVDDNGEWAEDETIPDARVVLRDLGFDINDYLTSETPKLCMKDGLCGGREFEITSVTKDAAGSYQLTLQRVYDEALGLYFPNAYYNLKPKDKFVITGIEMPDVYIQVASQRLLKAAKEYLDKNDKPRSVFQPEVDAIFMARQHDAFLAGNADRSLHDTIKEGDLMLFEDDDLSLEANIVIDSLVIKEKEDEIPTYEVVLREEKSVGTLEKIQNQIDSLSKGAGGGINTSQVSELIKAIGKNLFLSRLNPDTAQGLITFLQGLISQGDATFGASAKSDNFVEGLWDGSGWKVDRQGNMELTSLRVRDFLEVMQLIINRLQAVQGDVIYTEGDTIETVTLVSEEERTFDLEDGTQATETIRTYSLALKSQWEGYFTAQTEGAILKGVYNSLAQAAYQNGTAQVGAESPAAYYTSYMRVNSVNQAANTINVTLYPSHQCPSGRNFPPCELMNVARIGHETDTARQTHMMISSSEGFIRKMRDVDSPLTTEDNIAVHIGKLPEFVYEQLVKGGYLSPTDPDIEWKKQRAQVVVADYIIGKKFVEFDRDKGVLPTRYADRGNWTLPTAENGIKYYHRQPNPDSEEPTLCNEISCVWHYGCKWACMANLTTTEPKYNNTDWAFLEGNPNFTIEFEETDQLFDLDDFSCPLTVRGWLYNQDITASLRDADIEWTRYSEFADGTQRVNDDNAWALQFAQANRSGKAVSLTRADLGADNGYMPRNIRFTATAYLPDGLVASATLTF